MTSNSLTPAERQEFESRKYTMMEVMLLDNGAVVLCYPSREIASVIRCTSASYSEYMGAMMLEALYEYNSRPDPYQPPSTLPPLDLEIDI